MNKENNKKALAEQLKNKLNSPNYVAMPDLITHDDWHADMLPWILGGKEHAEDGWWISGTDINPNPNNKKQTKHLIYYNELEPEDWEEIVNLIEKKRAEKTQIWAEKKRNIDNKLNNQSNLYYYWGAGWRKRERGENADVWVEDKGMRGFVTLLGGRGNGLTYHLYIAENHPVLNSFAFKTGFYLIETNQPIEKRTGYYDGYSSTGGESNPYNFTKFVEADDQITITPYNIAEKSLIQPPRKINQSEERNEGMLMTKGGHNLTKKTSKQDQKIITYLIEYFQKEKIKEVKLESGQLVIKYNNNNNNQIVSGEMINNSNPQISQLYSLCQTQQNNSISKQDLEKMINTNQDTNQSERSTNSNKKLFVGLALGGGVLIVGIIIIYLLKNNSKRGFKK